VREQAQPWQRQAVNAGTKNRADIHAAVQVKAMTYRELLDAFRNHA
jgi:hypothetical protein